MLKTICLRGKEALSYLDDMARLRIEVFREFPYLYDGDRAYEEKYLASYFECSDSIVVLAFDGTQVVGASTGLPLAKAELEWQKAFEGSPYSSKEVFYFGESVLCRNYRGKGLGHVFFDKREEFAGSLSGITHTAFCAVVRDLNHPRRPTDYRTHDLFWTQRGYRQVPGMLTDFYWKDLDEDVESPKPMVFWIRKLAVGQSNQQKGVT
jgi:GNAT superfamily N-acetyltransferase